jgi:hypothetical protein
MSSTMVLNILLAIGAGLTFIGLVAVIIRAIKQGGSDSVFVTIERAGHKTRVLTFPLDSPQFRQLTGAMEGSRPPSPKSVRHRTIKVETPEEQKSSRTARKTSWLPAILRTLIILAVMLGGALAGAFVDKVMWAIIISTVAVIGVPLVSFLVILGSEQRTQRLIASIHSFRHYEKLITGRNHANNHDTDVTY